MRTAITHARNERNRRVIKQKKTIQAGFLSTLTSLDCAQAKRELIEKHNPFFYTFFRG